MAYKLRSFTHNSINSCLQNPMVLKQIQWLLLKTESMPREHHGVEPRFTSLFEILVPTSLNENIAGSQSNKYDNARYRQSNMLLCVVSALAKLNQITSKCVTVTKRVVTQQISVFRFKTKTMPMKPMLCVESAVFP